MSAPALRVDPLVWGHGPKHFEIFLEPTCPYSVRTFLKLDDLLATAGPDNITLELRMQSQPWHLFSGVVTRCVFAAASLPEGKEAAKKVLAAVAAHREEFEFEHHATGPNRTATPDDIIRRIEGYSRLELMEAFGHPELDKPMKLACRYARQNGIHVSPSFMIDGIFQPDMSSGDTVEDWASRLS